MLDKGFWEISIPLCRLIQKSRSETRKLHSSLKIEKSLHPVDKEIPVCMHRPGVLGLQRGVLK